MPCLLLSILSPAPRVCVSQAQTYCSLAPDDVNQAAALGAWVLLAALVTLDCSNQATSMFCSNCAQTGQLSTASPRAASGCSCRKGGTLPAAWRCCCCCCSAAAFKTPHSAAHLPAAVARCHLLALALGHAPAALIAAAVVRPAVGLAASGWWAQLLQSLRKLFVTLPCSEVTSSHTAVLVQVKTTRCWA